MSSITAILLAGGSGTRMRGYTEDKILMEVQGKPVFAYSIEAFIKSEVVDSLMIVYKDDQQKSVIEQWVCENILNAPRIFWTQGGVRRQDSVFAGLRALGQKTEYVFIHDLARPLIQSESIRKVHQALVKEDVAVLGRAVTDTIKQVSDFKICNDLDRDVLWAMETPQAFRYGLICKAYEEVERCNLQITDDASALSSIGHPVVIVESDFPNPKITLQSDLVYLEFLLTRKNYAAF